MSVQRLGCVAPRLMSRISGTLPTRINLYPPMKSTASPAAIGLFSSDKFEFRRTFINASNTIMRETARYASSIPPDFESTLRAGERIASAVQNSNRDWLNVAWTDGQSGRYPYVWLRDNCRCPTCFYPSCHQRSMLMADLDLEIKPTRIEIKDEGQNLEITWSDGHMTPFTAQWLQLHGFGDSHFDPVKKIEVVSWGAEFVETMPTFKYDDIITKRDSLYDWLESLVKFGIAIIHGSPQDGDTLKTVSERIAYQKKTLYGHDFRIETLPQDASCSLAYSSNELGLHTDLAYYCYRPGVQMLHCIRPFKGKGGENQFVDGKRVAEHLEVNDPELFKAITKVKLDYRCRNRNERDFHLQQSRPLIELGENGEFKSVACNDQVRSPHMAMPVEQVAMAYRAMKAFHQAMYREENLIQVKLEKGDIATFDNNRVLHGRLGFRVPASQEVKETKPRLLVGGYVDFDEVYSRMRILDEEMKGTPIA